ncbi:MAG TPA: hypothetical protein PK033_09160 [Acetivibrio sp.]|nr:hypothetical protein [Clostridium sp.]HOQ38290.1 hypothetical protein [Acetivibrio sp.]HQA58027.1 hypothetical protein [Acetivibrio sp.]
MDYTHKLPFIIGASVTIIVGILSYKGGYELKTICTRMSLSMVLSFLAGTYLRSFIERMQQEVKQKKELDTIKENQEIISEASKKNVQVKKSKIDLTAGEDTSENMHIGEENLYDEEFEPLKVTNVTIKDRDQKSQS